MSALARIFDLPSLPPDERAEEAITLAYMAMHHVERALQEGATLSPVQVIAINATIARLEAARDKVRRDAA